MNKKSKRTKSYERILNFSTQIDANKTILEIETLLSKSGATKIMKEYDCEGDVSSLNFIIITPKGNISIKMPVKIENMLEIFRIQVQDKKLPKKYLNNIEQANKVSWRIIKNWLEAQLSLIMINAVKLEEVFLPYVYDEKMNKTIFELLEDKSFNLKQISDR